ncbi:LysM and putative peptidoglycan-binding domain-containing protein 1 [Psilocybe cubensis]|uniref:LysM domain-containing protein n=2 Tax=Psilocybe cubensis TaxID=181762 RepID=A0A8H7Y737_PSICU|nr:LysM and putative peptidoglycan-binding domain-containing protein 1 [Psilocybe cubensis]KAH9485080.1 LysM and putative peptidoglycan-binding domain-containing protein 1 [Psilocybe cubensis]
MSYDKSDDLAYNPFAHEDDHRPPSASSSIQGYYSSAFFPKVSPSKPTLRRRKSLADKSFKLEQHPRNHARIPTEIQITPPYSAGLHPLKSALAATNNGSILHDLDVTRPYLSRIVNEGNLVDAPLLVDGTVADKIPPSQVSDLEKDVIVHQVSSKDSLAGVSLKYGISLPNLRRANQLWTSDSIHLRDVLYIPIDQASRAREYVPEPKLISLTPDTQDSPNDPFDDASTASSPFKTEPTNSLPSSSPVSVRRIPAKQLTYFPPSSSKATRLKENEDRDATSVYLHSPGNSKTSPGPNRYSPTPANNSLASILTALPIAASTRDEIITRLSFDSASSSFSDRSRFESDEEIGHELGNVSRQNSTQSYHANTTDNLDELDEVAMPTPKASQQPHRILPARSQTMSTTSSSLPKASYIHPTSSTAIPPRFYISHIHEASIRTSQLEPSPAMELPNFRSNTVGRSVGRVYQNHSEDEPVS